MGCVAMAVLMVALSMMGSEARVDCDVTKALSEDTFRSSFRNAYLAVYSTSRGNNLAKEADKVFAEANFKKVGNRGDNCEQRTEYTEGLCKTCVRKLGWQAAGTMFRGRRGRSKQAEFTRELRQRVCEIKDACVRRPRPSVSPIPAGELRLRIDSDDGKSPTVMFRFALVADVTSTFLSFAAADISGVTELWPIQGSILEYETSESDVEFFECASGMFEAKADVADIAAEIVRRNCYADGDGTRFNAGCVVNSLAWQVCEGLARDGCVPRGTRLLSQCAL